MYNLFLRVFVLLVSIMFSPGLALAAATIATDKFETSAGELEISFIGHGSLMFKYGDKIIHADPDSRLTDYTALPKADILLVTHEHRDHCDPTAIDILSTAQTALITNKACAAYVKNRIVMRNGDTKTVAGIHIEAVPAYNIVHMRSPGVPFHSKGSANGYVLTFGDKKVYVAGDTENVPEMKNLKGIDIAFLPVNLPYTMTPEMFADAAKSFNPKILYPYHFGETDMAAVQKLLVGAHIEVRMRDMK